MSDLRIEWDPLKARANARKHGITFQEAETAFYDDNALVIPDPDHSSSKSDSC
ncbi:MAG TPA: BrnT family toxin [Gemmatimonadaceae bacterium]|nr:BrnT family toxin [Gemmatimonadaceae bacterium]